MLECKAMATPMDSNLKLFADDSSELMDVTQYRQIIGSLMYLTNTRTYICFGVNTFSQYLVQPRRVHLIAKKHVMRSLMETMITDYMAIQMQIGLEVSDTGKADQVDAFVWVCYDFMV